MFQRQIVLKSAITEDRWNWEAQARQMFAKDWVAWASSLLPQLRSSKSRLTILLKASLLSILYDLQLPAMVL
jgi:hypothetical protein